MRKVSLLVALIAAVALSTAANAASKKAHQHHGAATPVTAGNTGGSPYMDATDAQRAKFFHDALFPFEAK